MGLFLAAAFVLGAVIGSFLNVVVFRLRTGVGLGGRSMCMSCGRSLSWYELVPIASFAAQGGRCRSCRARISRQYPLVEAATGILFLLVMRWLLGTGLTPAHAVTALVYAVASCFLVVIAAYDLRHKIIPDGLVYSFDALALAGVFSGGASFVHAPHLWTLLAGPVLAAPFAILWLVSRGRWIGLGDAKLVLGLGWLLGMAAGANAVVLAFWIGAAVSVAWLLATTGRVARRTEIPFAPFLIVGALVALFWHVDVLGLRELVPFIR